MSYVPYPSTLDAGGPAYGRSKSPQPYMHPSPQMGAPQPPAPIQAGDMTYTTSMGPDGRPIYHLFRAENASYRSPQGLIHGIQWVAIDPLYDEPENIRPASVDWIQQWGKNRSDPREEKLWKEWIRMEERRRKYDDRSYDRSARDYDKDYHTQDRRTRRGSFNSSDPYKTSPYPQPDYAEAPLSTSDYLGASPGASTRQRRLSQSRGPADDLEHRMRDMDIGDQRRVVRRKSFVYEDGQVPAQEYGSRGYRDDDYDHRGARLNQAGVPAYPPSHVMSLSASNVIPTTDRRVSPSYAYSDLPADSGSYPVLAPRPRSPYVNPVPQTLDRPRSPYINPGGGSPYNAPQALERPRSAYGNPQTLERPRSAYGNHPQALDRPRSPYAAPVDSNYSYSGVSNPGFIDVAAQQRGALINPVTFPEAFNRMPSFGRNLTSFEPFLISWLDNLAKDMPRLPAILVPHDITHQDWIKFMSDLTSVWLNQTKNPYPSGTSPRRSTLASSIIDSWNSAFFLPRRIELVLIKGRTRYSGPGAGRSDPRLSRAIDATLHGDLDEDDDDDDYSDWDEYDEDEGYNTGYGFYGGSGHRLPGDERWMAKASSARRRWIERARQERKSNQRRERQRRDRITRKKYSLYVMTTL